VGALCALKRARYAASCALGRAHVQEGRGSWTARAHRCVGLPIIIHSLTIPLSLSLPLTPSVSPSLPFYPLSSLSHSFSLSLSLSLSSSLSIPPPPPLSLYLSILPPQSMSIVGTRWSEHPV
jgi:hypothetical protein